MLAVCDKFATEYCVTFSNTKSKCITFNHKKSGRDASATLPSFAIGGNATQNVDHWPHLGHVFNAHLTDDDDILAHRNSFIGQANNFFVIFQCLTLKLKTLCLRYTVTVITVPNCGTLQITSSKITALHGGKACKDYGRFHTIRAN
jgi:hypothetical protein